MIHRSHAAHQSPAGNDGRRRYFISAPSTSASDAIDEPVEAPIAAPKPRRKIPWATLVVGFICVGLALQGLLLVMQRKPPQRIPTIATSNVRPPSPPAPLIEPTPEPPPEEIFYPEPNTVPPAPVIPPAPIPAAAPATPAAESADWLHEMQQALIQCQSVFCRERVRWKYCNNRWDSVPVCASSKNSVQESAQSGEQNNAQTNVQ